ncbi:hypothetical protein JCM1841_002365 [Sporobolomyces salmonicolor]
MSTAAASPPAHPSLAGLPSDLKKRIIRALDEIDYDEEESDDEGDDGEESKKDGEDAAETEKDKGWATVKDELDLIGRPMRDSLKNLTALSLVNREFSELCFSFIWRNPDLIERTNEALLYFIESIMPRHAARIEALFLMQSAERMLESDPSRYQSAGSSTPPTEAARESQLIEAVERLTGVAPTSNDDVRKSRVRSLLFAEIIKRTPNLEAIDFEGLLARDDEGEGDESGLKDHVLEAVKAHGGAKLRELGYTLTPDSVGSEGDLAKLLEALPKLTKLRLECFGGEASAAGRQALLHALVGLEKLEELDLGESDFVDDAFAALPFACPLKSLTLGEFLELSFPAFVQLVEHFSATLEALEIDGTPSEGATDVATGLGKPLALPKLKILDIASPHDARILECFPGIEDLRVGFCPNFKVDDVVAFVEKHGGETLKELEVEESGAFDDEELALLEKACEDNSVEFSTASGLDDFLDADGDEWSDEEGDDDDDEE